uniref:Antennal ionotropic receptor 75d-2 n=1 Tax=Dendrolimus punctatus TaxID=238572 RepID=A0A2K8GL87_9NEOP|nr:antennal ionotropic receptor 75d-2 [Dendrolimus punctatus]
MSVRLQASDNRAFVSRFSWLLLHNGTYETNIIESFFYINILPDSDVKISGPDYLLDIYKIKPNHPLVITSLDLNRNSSLKELSSFWNNFPTPVKRRKDLSNVYLTAATIVTQPQYFKGWSDLTNREIDTYPKLTYPLMMLCSEDLNFRYNLRQVDLYGDELNGSFNGLAGLLQRNEIEVGITSMFMRADRFGVLHYSSETVSLTGAFIFRQPSQSAVSNIFLLPFSRDVWLASAVVFLSSGLVLALLSRQLFHMDPILSQLTLSEAFTFALGTVCQQGFHVTPVMASARVVMFFTLTTALFAFTAYSAKIVAILQTPSDAIQTIDDLTNSPMGMGIQETTYKKVYIAESNEPATQRLYRHKLLPLGERAYLSVVDGISRVRSGLFAYQVEQSSGYDVISKTFEEHEKCGLKEIEAFSLPMVAIPIKKHSGYRELLASRLRWQREVGLIDRASSIWLAAKPRCDSAASGFVSVGLLDILPAIQVLAAGAFVAVLILLAEITFAKSSRD